VTADGAGRAPAPFATPDAYFDTYWTSDDPWSQVGRWSELRKFDLTVASLPRARYRRAFEPGCGTGLLTERLAPRCDEVVARDRHARAAAVTGRRCARFAHVDVAPGAVPDAWPDGAFDLVVLSEVLYYLDDAALASTLAATAAALVAGGDLVAVHFRPVVAEHVRTGDAVHAALAEHPAWVRLARHVECSFVLEVFRRR
jgi:SAM-dependent methyltransferase